MVQHHDDTFVCVFLLQRVGGPGLRVKAIHTWQGDGTTMGQCKSVSLPAAIRRRVTNTQRKHSTACHTHTHIQWGGGLHAYLFPEISMENCY